MGVGSRSRCGPRHRRARNSLRSHFWIERPGANAAGLVIRAVAGPSTTGAYRFSVTPGAETIMDVDLTLFPRTPLENVGIAPLTSMFLFDESVRNRIEDFRDEVHDSDGLQIMMDSGEQTWRPLANPTQLQVSSFTSSHHAASVSCNGRSSPIIRSRHSSKASESTWIEPRSNWGGACS
jgi:glucans biosynthesis protein